MNTIQRNAAIVAATAMAVTVAVTTTTMVNDGDSTTDDVTIPSVVIPQVNVPQVNVPKVDIPQLAIASVETPTIASMMTVDSVMLDSLRLPKVDEKSKIKVPEVDTYRREMQQAIEFRSLQRKHFADLRNLDHDKSISYNSPIWKKWLRVYQNNQNFDFKKNPISYQIKMIAEVNMPITNKEVDILDKNLEFYKEHGYNSVLLAFNGTEPLSKLIDVEDLIISKGLKVFIAYSGPENLKWSMFVDPSKLEEYLSALGAKADGIVIGWRRTALHLFIPDKPYVNFILKSAMERNDKLIVLGEAYLGETADTNGKSNSITINLPANASGVLINGIGFNGVDVERALKGVFSQVKDQKRIAVIVGDCPYYLSRYANKYNFQQNLKIKQNLEKQFINAGCSGTITLHGDSEPIYLNGRQISSDSLCYSEAK